MKQEIKGGAYVINCGDIFYIGSTNNFQKRRHEHLWRLKSGTHHIKRLLDAFNQHGMRFQSVLIADDPSDKAMLKALEQKLLDEHQGNPNLANVNSIADGIGPWQKVVMRRGRQKMSDESRKRISDAKMGGKHPNAKRVTITDPRGKEFTYATIKEASQALGLPASMISALIEKGGEWSSNNANYEWIHGFTGTIGGRLVTCS